MSETGATAEQIEAALRREILAYYGGDEEFTAKVLARPNPYGGFEHMRRAIEHHAALLVEPGMVIANAADVISPELRAAIEELLANASALDDHGTHLVIPASFEVALRSAYYRAAGQTGGDAKP